MQKLFYPEYSKTMTASNNEMNEIINEILPDETLFDRKKLENPRRQSRRDNSS